MCGGVFGERLEGLLGLLFGGLATCRGPEGALGRVAIGVYGLWCGGFGEGNVIFCVRFFFGTWKMVVVWHFACCIGTWGEL